MNRLILVINTGNTSTKISVYQFDKELFVESIKHSDKILAKFPDINSQKDYREQLILNFLKERKVELKSLSAVAARGGLLKPLSSGTYLVDDNILKDLIEGKRGMHASHLSAQIGNSIAKKAGVKCFIVDPISVDEFIPVARYSGHKLFQRIMLSHALNMKAVCKRYSKEKKLDYNKLNLLVIHLGTGISVSIHEKGKMIDSINSSEEGTFSPDRSGGLPILQIAKYIIENNIDFKSFSKTVFGLGGLQSYLGTKDFMIVEERFKKNENRVVEIVNAMIYQIAKDTGSMATVVNGKVDKILITGGMAYADFLVKLLIKKIKFIAPVEIYPGEDEMKALAEGVTRVLKNQEKVKIY